MELVVLFPYVEDLFTRSIRIAVIGYTVKTSPPWILYDITQVYFLLPEWIKIHFIFPNST